jgi:ABC-2 type transport system permease protein
MIVLAITHGLSATSTAVNSDMIKGIINRFKVMDVSRGAVLNAQVIASMLRNLI